MGLSNLYAPESHLYDDGFSSQIWVVLTDMISCFFKVKDGH